MPIDTNLSVTTYQNADGSNLSTAGVENKMKVGNATFGTYTGVGTNFGNNSDFSAIIDFKGSMPYGNSNISGAFRIRNNLGENKQTVQLRFQPANINIPLNDKVNLYADPYVAMKIDYNSGKQNTNVGIFGGASVKVNKASIFVEGQLYDVTNIKNESVSFNVGISIPL